MMVVLKNLIILCELCAHAHNFLVPGSNLKRDEEKNNSKTRKEQKSSKFRVVKS